MTKPSSPPITPQAAQHAIELHWPAIAAEQRPLAYCTGRILRQDVYAERDNPPYDRVCMDGIAISSTAAARGQRQFAIHAIQAAGSPPLQLPSTDAAIEVMTGSVLPRGTDCVIPMEEYSLSTAPAASLSAASTTASAAVASLKDNVRSDPYRNVQRRGEDSQPGVPMLTAGTRLGSPEIAVVASAGLANVAVSRQPTFMVVSTGDELIEPGKPIAEHQIRRSNAYAIIAALRERGFESISNDHIADHEATLTERLQQHLNQHDAMILSGGVSKGKFDLVPKVLKNLGVREVFYRVAQRPGMPLWFGVGPTGQVVFGLPGNPVATLVCLIRYVIPGAVAAMGTQPAHREQLPLARAFSPGRPITQFVPIAVTHDPAGRPTADPRPTRGPGDFLGLTGTAGFVELPPQAEGFSKDFVAQLYRW